MTKAKPKKPVPHVGVGSPGILRLELFGRVVADAFDTLPYLVGSAATGKVWRDVDIRVILDDRIFWRLFDDQKRSPMTTHSHGTRWASVCMAYSALGLAMTGLPIDFQVQSMTHANGQYGNMVRVPLGLRYEP